jgi:hypothetical protein
MFLTPDQSRLLGSNQDVLCAYIKAIALGKKKRAVDVTIPSAQEALFRSMGIGTNTESLKRAKNRRARPNPA